MTPTTTLTSRFPLPHTCSRPCAAPLAWPPPCVLLSVRTTLHFHSTTSSQSSRSASVCLSAGRSCHRTTFFPLSGMICSCQPSLSALCSLALLVPTPTPPGRSLPTALHPAGSAPWCQRLCYHNGDSFVSPAGFLLELLSSQAYCFSSVHITVDDYALYTFISFSSLSVLLPVCGSGDKAVNAGLFSPELRTTEAKGDSK